jgi:putative two-component system response regulator
MPENDNIQKSILLVDDDDLHLKNTELMLKDEYKIFMAKSGKEALEFLNNDQIIPDLILLDILMPEMDGWVVFDRIHDIAALEHTPILFYTSLEEESAKEKAYELGIFDYITKPCKKPVLLNIIKDSLQKAEVRKHQQNT